jgi:hypothetical protein
MRWFVVCGLIGIFLFPAPAMARADRPAWLVLIDSVTYLRGLPEVAWVRAEDHHLMIGWNEMPARFRAINFTAARNASRALPKEDVYVFSLHAEQKDWRPDNGQPPLCRTVAQNTVILDSNC